MRPERTFYKGLSWAIILSAALFWLPLAAALAHR